LENRGENLEIREEKWQTRGEQGENRGENWEIREEKLGSEK
jgi:hypothetical protein